MKTDCRRYSINVVEWKTRTEKVLKKLDPPPETLGDLCLLTEWDVLRQKNAGRKTLADIQEHLAACGLALRKMTKKEWEKFRGHTSWEKTKYGA